MFCDGERDGEDSSYTEDLEVNHTYFDLNNSWRIGNVMFEEIMRSPKIGGRNEGSETQRQDKLITPMRPSPATPGRRLGSDKENV